MSGPQVTGLSSHVVLIGDETSFAGGYVAAVLRGRALSVIGPVGASADAIDLVRQPETRVVIFLGDVTANRSPDLLAILADRGVPCLTLTTAGAPASTDLYSPTLTQPFAAFQVARWVLEQLLRQP